MARRCELTGKGVMVGNNVSHALRTVEHRGGLDAFLLKQDDADLSPLALGLKKEIRATLAG